MKKPKTHWKLLSRDELNSIFDCIHKGMSRKAICSRHSIPFSQLVNIYRYPNTGAYLLEADGGHFSFREFVAQRNKKIMGEALDGKSAKQLAKKHELTPTHIQRILNQQAFHFRKQQKKK